jgi:hypothetical protein
MTGSELIVALFALVFLAFCLTAIAVIAMSKDKDDVANKSVSALRQIKPDHLMSSAKPIEPARNDEDEAKER